MRDLDAHSYYRILGIPENADAAAVEAAYYRLVRVVHPDCHARERQPERRRAIVRLYSRIGEAYEVLSTPESKAAYDRGLPQGRLRITDEQVRRETTHSIDPKVPRARELFAAGQEFLSRNDARRAASCWQLAQQFDPDSKVLRDALTTLAADSTPSGRLKAQPASAVVPVREHARHALARPVKVRCADWDQFRSFYTRDISRGGVFVRTTSPPAQGTPVHVSLTLPDGRSIKLDGIVARVVPAGEKADGPAGFGLRFTRLDEAARETLDAILDGLDAVDHSAGETAILEVLIDTLVQMRMARPAETLGIPPGAEPAVLERAYERLAKRFDPALYADYHDERLQQAAAEVMALVQDAYEALRPPPPPEPDSSGTLIDDEFVQDAEPAVWELPAEASSRIWKTSMDEGRHQEAAILLARAVDASPNDTTLRANYHLAAAYVARAAGDRQMMRRHLENVLAFDPNCEPAIRGMRGEDDGEQGPFVDAARTRDDES